MAKPKAKVQGSPAPTQAQSASHRLKVRIDDLKVFDPMTANQELFYDQWKTSSNLAFVLHGMPGTGKTFIAVYKALETVMDKGNPFNGVIIVRSAVTGREIGHLPGDEDEKMAAFEAPYVGICADLFGRADAYQRLKEQGTIEFMSTSHIRGITLDNKIVVVDEFQNMTWEELYTIATRVGTRTRIVFSGDVRQNDLNKRKNDVSGLPKFMAIMDTMEGCPIIEYQIADIVRSDFVKRLIIAVTEYEDAIA